MYTVKIKFDWVSEDENYHYLELWGRRMGNVIYARETPGRFSGYCCPTHCKSHFGTVEEAKEWVVGEVRKYFEANNFEFTETSPKYLHKIKCDRCGKLANFDGGGGNCQECGDDLCRQCAESWTEVVEDGEIGHCVCKRCRDKFAEKAECIEGDTPCDRCGKHADVGNGGGICTECEDILCGTCGWWSDEDDSPRCIRCRDTRTGDDLLSEKSKLDNANRLIDRKNESLEMFLRYCEAHGISGDDIRTWHENNSNN
jgi:hypothetical protein